MTSSLPHQSATDWQTAVAVSIIYCLRMKHKKEEPPILVWIAGFGTTTSA